jgi:hypothetical protein
VQNNFFFMGGQATSNRQHRAWIKYTAARVYSVLGSESVFPFVNRLGTSFKSIGMVRHLQLPTAAHIYLNAADPGLSSARQNHKALTKMLGPGTIGASAPATQQSPTPDRNLASKQYILSLGKFASAIEFATC